MMKKREAVNIMWFRGDLRLDDNTALFHALSDGMEVLPIFIFDEVILDQLEDKNDRRVDFIFQSLEYLNEKLKDYNSGIQYYYGKPAEIFREIIDQYDVNGVYTNEDYEPYAIRRDTEIREILSEKSIRFHSYKDQVIFAKSEILKSDGTPYTVYSPYAKAWDEMYLAQEKVIFPSETKLDRLLKFNAENFGLAHIGFAKTDLLFKPFSWDTELLKAYAQKRSMPHLDGTSKISIHLRFGTLSIRSAVKTALEHSFKFYRELIWRDFFMQILYHFPETQSKSFKPAYDTIEWKNDEHAFKRWKSGTTGFPLVDAGIRELNATGFMHNRVRMVAASFLIKDLLIDWRWGEAYFAQKLLDYDLSQNIGNWQWCAGSGCDAAPYFRIFNPDLQLQKFDPKLFYVKKWIPEYGTDAYPAPMLDHTAARAEALVRFKKALSR